MRTGGNPAPRPQEKPYFLFVGRLELIKGLQTLIELWKRVPQYDLLVAGTGSYEPQLRAMAADNPHIKILRPAAAAGIGSALPPRDRLHRSLDHV